MSAGLRSWWESWRQARAFLSLDPASRSIVFYAEDSASWVHWEAILRELTGPMGREVCYLTSDPSDPILRTGRPRIRPFWIGDGPARTWLFLNLRADVTVMNMPDLETFQVKRSRVHPVHYAYLFHSLASIRIYRAGALDHFDTVLCAGPHHMEEIRATESAGGLKPKRLVSHGFGKLDALMAEHARIAASLPPAPRGPRRVLVAPTWGAQALLETCGEELVRVLVEAGYHVTLRPHPRTRRDHPELIRSLKALLDRHPPGRLETDLTSQESFHAADIMVSDWSGAAFEYALGLERPVLFIDVPGKINNPGYASLLCEPLEVTIRERVGAVLDPRRLAEAPRQIEALCADPGRFSARIRELRDRILYNVGKSGAVGAEEIARLADERGSRPRLASGAPSDELLRRLLQEIPPEPARGEKSAALESLLRAAQAAGEGKEAQESDLETLCRAAARAGRAEKDISVELWPLAGAVLLRSADPRGGTGRLDRELALKCLNAACGALDAAVALGRPAHLQGLREWRESLLEQTEGEWAHENDPAHCTRL